MSTQEQHHSISDAEGASASEQAVETAQDFAKNPENPTACEPQQTTKSGGKGLALLALLALLVAVAVGAAGHYLTNRKFSEVEQQLQALAKQPTAQTAVELPTFEQEKAQIATLQTDYQSALAKITQLEQQQADYVQQIDGLKTQVQKLGSAVEIEPTVWLLSDADFLLNNALRKLALENDIESAKTLMTEADKVLSEIKSSDVATVRNALNADLAQLNALNEVDQNSLMQRLAQLANLVDEMPLLENEMAEKAAKNDEVSDSVADWQDNLEKSANSFLNHFIRISDKGTASDKVFIAPNQEIYLRENIRLRLQIAILTVPRQQNELYKQSLDAVSTWVRSYFDVENEHVKTFLSELDELIEQSIYVDAPNRLQSLELLEKLLNKPTKKLDKIQLESEKSLEQLKVEDAPKTEAEQAQPQPTPAP